MARSCGNCATLRGMLAVEHNHTKTMQQVLDERTSELLAAESRLQAYESRACEAQEQMRRVSAMGKRISADQVKLREQAEYAEELRQGLADARGELQSQAESHSEQMQGLSSINTFLKDELRDSEETRKKLEAAVRFSLQEDGDSMGELQPNFMQACPIAPMRQGMPTQTSAPSTKKVSFESQPRSEDLRSELAAVREEFAQYEAQQAQGCEGLIAFLEADTHEQCRHYESEMQAACVGPATTERATSHRSDENEDNLPALWCRLGMQGERVMLVDRWHRLDGDSLLTRSRNTFIEPCADPDEPNIHHRALSAPPAMRRTHELHGRQSTLESQECL